MSSSHGRSQWRQHRQGLSERDPNQQTPAAQHKREVLSSKTPFRSTPRPPSNWPDVGGASVSVGAAAEASVERPVSAHCRSPILGAQLKWALDLWKQFRVVRLRHLALLTQALQWRAQAVFWAWCTQTAAQRTAYQRECFSAEVLNMRLLTILERRRRRIFERWYVWAMHAERLRADEERAIIAGQSWRAARVFHSWHEWARTSSARESILRLRQRQYLYCWQTAAVEQCTLRAQIRETCGWRRTRMLQTSIDKLWVFAAHQQRMACILNQVVQIREWRVLERCLSSWHLIAVMAIEKHELKTLAHAFWRENVLAHSVHAWKSEVQLLRRYGQALMLASQRVECRILTNAFEAWARFIRQDLKRQRWDSTARRALRAWQWRVTLKWEVQAASMELERRMNRWSVFQAWCTWLRIHDNKCAIQWMLHRSLVLFLTGCLRRWRAAPIVRENILLEGRPILALHTKSVHFHAWHKRTASILSRHDVFVQDMLDARCRRMLNLWRQLARTRRLTRARGARCAANTRKRRLQFGITGWLQASEILRTKIALELGTMERVLRAWRGLARCAAVRRHVDIVWRCRRLSGGFRSWAWHAGRRTWCRRVVNTSDQLRGQQVLLKAVTEWRYISVRMRRLETFWIRVKRRQQRRVLLAVWERLLLNRSVRKCITRLRHRRLQWAMVAWQKFRADANHAKRLEQCASMMWRRRLALAGWRRWMILHGLETRVKICRTAWRLRMLAELFSSFAEELLCAHELYRKAASHRWKSLGTGVFCSWRRWILLEAERREVWALVGRIADGKLAAASFRGWRHGAALAQKERRTAREAAGKFNRVAILQLCRVAIHRWGRYSRRIAVAQRRSQCKLARSMARLRLLTPTWLAWKLHQQHWQRRKRQVDGPRIAVAHYRHRIRVKAWVGWVAIHLQGRQHAAEPMSTLTPIRSSGKRKMDEMSTIAEEGSSFVASDDSNVSVSSSGTAWNTPMTEPPEVNMAGDDTDATRTASWSGDQNIGVARVFGAARTSPRYETDVVTAMHLEYTTVGRRELMAAKHWFRRLAPRAWDSWKGIARAARAKQRKATRHYHIKLLQPVWLALGEF